MQFRHKNLLGHEDRYAVEICKRGLCNLFGISISRLKAFL